MIGLGKAILTGAKAYNDATDRAEDEKARKQQLAYQALQMALMNEQEGRAKETFNLNKQNTLDEGAHDFLGTIPEGTLIDPAIMDKRIKGSSYEGLLPADATLPATRHTGLGALIGAKSAPVRGAEQRVDAEPTGKGFRSIMPLDSKAELASNKLATDLQRAQIAAYTSGQNAAAATGRNDADNDMAMQIALLRMEQAASQGRNAVTVSDRISLENRYAADWSKANQNQNTRKQAISQMKMALQDLGPARFRAPAAQAIIIQFNKLIDPGSVVRESEYARTPEGSPMVSRFMNLSDKLTLGGPNVSPEELSAYVTLAEKFIAGGDPWLKSVQTRIDHSADRFGLDRRSIYGTLPEESAAPPPPPAGGPRGFRANPDGTFTPR